MKKSLLILVLCLIPAIALAGSYTGSWPNIGQTKALDAIACATQALTRTDQDHSCREVPSWNKNSTSAYAAECRFVMALSGVKTVWHLDGTYDANQNFTGTITQTLPTCTGFLCGIMGTVHWYGRSPMPPQTYSYGWNDGYGAQCDVIRLPGSGQIAGDFYGNY